jgi:hypothetical protein
MPRMSSLFTLKAAGQPQKERITGIAEVSAQIVLSAVKTVTHSKVGFC